MFSHRSILLYCGSRRSQGIIFGPIPGKQTSSTACNSLLTKQKYLFDGNNLSLGRFGIMVISVVLKIGSVGVKVCSSALVHST